MATSTPESQIEYLLAALKTCKTFEPDYHALSQAMGVNSANTAQKKFKAIVEKGGQYKLINARVVDNPDHVSDPNDPGEGSSTSKSVTTPTAASMGPPPTPTKKRKVAADTDKQALTPTGRVSRAGRITAGVKRTSDDENEDSEQKDAAGKGKGKVKGEENDDQA